MSALRQAAKAALPDPALRRIQDWRRRKQELDSYGPAETIDPAPLHLLRDAPLEELADPARLEQLLPELGLNAERLEQFPAELYPYTGRGLLHWQFPNQFSRYLVDLGGLGVRNYLEIGVRHGGTFAITVEYLRRFGELEWALGMDLRVAPGLEAWAQTQATVETAACDSRSRQFRSLVEERSPIDLALIDGDHSEAGCRADFELLADRTRLLAFHDIANELVPGVRAVWEDVRADGRFECREYVAQYDDTRARLGHDLLGIGLAVRRDA